MQDPATLVTNPDLIASVSQISAFLSHLTVGGVTAHLLQWAKGRPGVSRIWAVMSDRAKSISAAALALLGSLGVTAAFHYDPTKGLVTATFAGVTAASIGTHAWGFVQSYVLQTGWYRQIIKATAVTGAVPVPGAPNLPVPVVLQKVQPKESQ